MHARIALFALLLAGAGLTTAAATTPPSAERGHAIFSRKCAPCHGQGPGDDGTPNLPGTAALARKYKGERPAALEKRTDLPADVIRLFVRNGSGAMPMFRKTELSDADIEDVAAYLQASSAAQPAK
jgi:mono/diheme cytochrome c family protein